MPMDFVPERHTLAAYQEAVGIFRDHVGATPIDVLRQSGQFSLAIWAWASWLDDWDIWLFSEDAPDV